MKKTKKWGRKVAAVLSAGVLAVTGAVSSLSSRMTVTAADLDLDNYARLLQYSLYFYDANYCGVGAGEKSHFSWRDDCHKDGTANGGFHDAGDGIICGLTEGFTASTLGWMYYEYKDEFQKTGTYAHFQDIADEFAQFFKTCTTLDGSGNVTKLIYEIGDDGADHGRWQPPEMMNRSSSEYYSTTNGASNVAAQYAAALAQNYLNFGNAEDLEYAKALYAFAAKYRTMTYDQQTYSDKDVQDDISWAAGWLYLATNEDSYLTENSKYTSSHNDWTNDYCYANAYLGAGIINAEITGNWSTVTSYIDGIVNANQNQFYIMNSWGSARHNTLMQTCAMVVTKHKEQSGKDYAEWCKKQTNMILGDNNANVCLVVGYNDVSATSPHHRAASGIVETGGWAEYNNWSGNYADSPNSHVLYGALCGGPTGQDFNTFRKFDAKDATSNEVALDYQVGLVGAAVGLFDYYGTGAVVDAIGDEVTVYAEEIAAAHGEQPGPGTTTPVETTTTMEETTTEETTTTEEEFYAKWAEGYEVPEQMILDDPDQETTKEIRVDSNRTIVDWTTSDSSVVELTIAPGSPVSDTKRVLTAVGEGTAEIVVTFDNGETLTATVNVARMIVEPADKLVYPETVQVGETFQIKLESVFYTNINSYQWSGEPDSNIVEFTNLNGNTIDGKALAPGKVRVDLVSQYGSWYRADFEIVGEVTTTVATEETTTIETTTETIATETTVTDNSEETAETTTATTVFYPENVMYGDVNLDGKVELVDAILLNKACAGQVTLTEDASANADCNASGGVDTSDSIVLLRFLVHLISTLPSAE